MTFPAFWQAYPAQSKYKGSKAKAERLFNGLSLKKQARVMESLEPYSAFLGEKDNQFRQPMMASTYLNHRNQHWETYAPQSVHTQLAKQDHERQMAEIRARNARQKAHSLEQWRDRYERQHGYRPE